MTFVRTKSFNLAIYIQGDPNSSKLALVLPGKLDTKDYAHMKSHVNFLADKGFFALSFDPPGTWQSPGNISLYNMTNYLKAINELIEYFGNKPTLTVGHSRGASMAILAALRNSSVTGFVAIFTPFTKNGYIDKSDVALWEKQGYLISKRDLPPGGGPEVKEFKLPFSFYEDQLHFNVDGLKKSTKSKLFILGTRDTLARPEGIKGLYEISSEPKELYKLDSDHNYRLHENLIHEVNTVIESFLKKNNL